MVCSKCGANNEAGSVFCGNCGTKIVTAQQAAQPGANMQYQQVPQAVPPVTKVIPPPTPQAIPPVTNIPPQPVYQQPMNGAPVMQPVYNQAVQYNAGYDWERVQPRYKPAGGRALIFAVSLLVMGIAFVLWTFAVTVGS